MCCEGDLCFIATANRQVIVRNLAECTSPEINRFTSCGRVQDIAYSDMGSYVVTTELKSWNSRDSGGGVALRVYSTWQEANSITPNRCRDALGVSKAPKAWGARPSLMEAGPPLQDQDPGMEVLEFVTLNRPQYFSIVKFGHLQGHLAVAESNRVNLYTPVMSNARFNSKSPHPGSSASYVNYFYLLFSITFNFPVLDLDMSDGCYLAVRSNVEIQVIEVYRNVRAEQPSGAANVVDVVGKSNGVIDSSETFFLNKLSNARKTLFKKSPKRANEIFGPCVNLDIEDVVLTSHDESVDWLMHIMYYRNFEPTIELTSMSLLWTPGYCSPGFLFAHQQAAFVYVWSSGSTRPVTTYEYPKNNKILKAVYDSSGNFIHILTKDCLYTYIAQLLHPVPNSSGHAEEKFPQHSLHQLLQDELFPLLSTRPIGQRNFMGVCLCVVWPRNGVVLYVNVSDKYIVPTRNAGGDSSAHAGRSSPAASEVIHPLLLDSDLAITTKAKAASVLKGIFRRRSSIKEESGPRRMSDTSALSESPTQKTDPTNEEDICWSLYALNKEPLQELQQKIQSYMETLIQSDSPSALNILTQHLCLEDVNGDIQPTVDEGTVQIICELLVKHETGYEAFLENVILSPLVSSSIVVQILQFLSIEKTSVEVFQHLLHIYIQSRILKDHSPVDSLNCSHMEFAWIIENCRLHCPALLNHLLLAKCWEDRFSMMAIPCLDAMPVTSPVEALITSIYRLCRDATLSKQLHIFKEQKYSEFAIKMCTNKTHLLINHGQPTKLGKSLLLNKPLLFCSLAYPHIHWQQEHSQAWKFNGEYADICVQVMFLEKRLLDLTQRQVTQPASSLDRTTSDLQNENLLELKQLLCHLMSLYTTLLTNSACSHAVEAGGNPRDCLLIPTDLLQRRFDFLNQLNPFHGSDPTEQRHAAAAAYHGSKAGSHCECNYCEQALLRIQSLLSWNVNSQWLEWNDLVPESLIQLSSSTGKWKSRLAGSLTVLHKLHAFFASGQSQVDLLLSVVDVVLPQRTNLSGASLMEHLLMSLRPHLLASAWKVLFDMSSQDDAGQLCGLQSQKLLQLASNGSCLSLVELFDICQHLHWLDSDSLHKLTFYNALRLRNSDHLYATCRLFAKDG